MSSLEVRDLTVEVPTRQGSFLLLRDLTFSLPENDFGTVIGPLGCGKTGLLKTLAGMLRPHPSSTLSLGRRPLSELRRGEVSYVPEGGALVPWRTVEGNVGLALEILGPRSPEDKRRVRQALTLVGLRDYEDLYPHQLPSGLEARVALARGLISDPSLLLLDEPFIPYDSTRMALDLWLQDLWMKSKRTVLLATHDVVEAILLSDRVIVLEGPPGRVKEIRLVELPRPRTLEMVLSPDFLRAVELLRAALPTPRDILSAPPRPRPKGSAGRIQKPSKLWDPRSLL